MNLFLAIILIVGLAGIIGNQYSLIRRIEELQKTIAEINMKIKDK